MTDTIKGYILEGIFEREMFMDASFEEDELGKYIHYSRRSGWYCYYFNIDLAVDRWEKPFDGVAYTSFTGFSQETNGLKLFLIDGKLYTTDCIDRIYTEQHQKKVGRSYDISYSIVVTNKKDTTETHDMTYGTRHEPKEYHIRTLSGMKQKMDILEMVPYAR